MDQPPKKRKRAEDDDGELLPEMEHQMQPWWSVEHQILAMIERKMENKPFYFFHFQWGVVWTALPCTFEKIDLK